MRKYKVLSILLAILLFISACGFEENNEESKETKSSDFISKSGKGDPLRIVAGSENKVLEPIIEKYSEESGKKVEMVYKGSLDIMRLLQSEEIEYDAIWPASTIWINMGDKNRVLKHTETTSITPVVFGIKKSLAESLNFVDRDDIKLEEIINAIEDGKLKFAMTSATQSNSGASAYLAFLTALSENPNEGLTSKDLENENLTKNIKSLLNGVNRSSGSSNWLVDLFLMDDYDAMVNYEQLIIQTNMELEKQGKEPLYAVYPVDGLSISDSPLSYVNKGNDKKEQDFLEFQEYILSNKAQLEIEKTGKRNSYGNINEESKDIYKESWGIKPDKILSPIRLPQNNVIEESLNLYQTSFKKPSLTMYVLDYSGSMDGDGIEQMTKALEQVLLPENASNNLLLGTTKDKTYLIPFSSETGEISMQEGNDLSVLYEKALDEEAYGGTSLYEAVIDGLDMLEKEDLSKYNPSIVLLTDGAVNGLKTYRDFEKIYKELDKDIPIFSILFGSAEEDELEKIANLTNARVFDGRKDLIKAFQTVKGYN